MKRRLVLLLVIMLLFLCGCSAGRDFGAKDAMESTEAVAEATVPATIPEDGNPGDVTCKGSYTGTENGKTVVAMSGVAELTNEQLAVWYWAEVAQYCQENHDIAPDFERPLEEQVCEIDSSVNSWQQYFLKEALSAWHNAQALVQHADEVPLTTEEAYQPNRVNTEKYMTGMPAAEVLYGYYSHYRPNSMHQAYLDGIPQMLTDLAKDKGYQSAADMAQTAFGSSEAAVEAFAYSSNRAYMYFTHLSHYIEPTQEELDTYYAEHASEYASHDEQVDFRQILLIPDENPEKGWTVTVAEDGTVTCPEEAWVACEEEAQEMLAYWRKKNRGTEATFGETAHHQSRDTGTAANGGLYQGIRKGQMLAQIDAWCFDPARQTGDTVIMRSPYGVHILYFSRIREIARMEAETDYYRQQQEAILTEAREMFPMEVSYDKIFLVEAEAAVSAGDLLYPDIAHERFPEVPLYLQQDYPKTMFGGFKITTNGCGITSLAMLASYMTDDELTPPEMCARYGRYSHNTGTDGMIFNIESAVMGFYLKEKTYEPRIAKAALEEGHIVVSVQHPGYWTRAGHYIVCERMNEEGLIQVRDSNIYNYGKIKGHQTDEHKWGSITAAGSGLWIFEKKVARIDACSRCGSPEGITESLLNQDYICQKCTPALLRRGTYLGA